MKIKNETVSCKLRLKNIKCNYENIVRIKQKVSCYAILILLLFLLLTVEPDSKSLRINLRN